MGMVLANVELVQQTMAHCCRQHQQQHPRTSNNNGQSFHSTAPHLLNRLCQAQGFLSSVLRVGEAASEDGGNLLDKLGIGEKADKGTMTTDGDSAPSSLLGSCCMWKDNKS